MKWQGSVFFEIRTSIDAGNVKKIERKKRW